MFIPLILLLGATVLVLVFDLDRRVASLFWDRNEGWTGEALAWARFLYEFGTWPALAAAAVGGVRVVLTRLAGQSTLARRPLATFLALLMILGPGLVVNTLCKEHLPRTRPREVASFDGATPFQPFGVFQWAGDGRSFPSGHASMGFYWLGLFVFFWKERRRLAWTFAALGLAHGGLLGLARLVRGSHWLSDVVWSAGLVYLTAWVLWAALHLWRRPEAGTDLQRIDPPEEAAVLEGSGFVLSSAKQE